MGSETEPDVDALYGLPPGEFVAARDALARRLKKEGHAARAAEVKARPKPSTSAWIVNQLARTARRELDALLEAGEALREAQADAVGGRGATAMKAAMLARRDAVSTLVTAARGVLAGAGLPATASTLERVAETLNAVSAMPEAPALGRLSQDVVQEDTDLTLLLGGGAPPPPATTAAPRPPPPAEPARAAPPKEAAPKRAQAEAAPKQTQAAAEALARQAEAQARIARLAAATEARDRAAGALRERRSSAKAASAAAADAALDCDRKRLATAEATTRAREAREAAERARRDAEARAREAAAKEAEAEARQAEIARAGVEQARAEGASESARRALAEAEGELARAEAELAAKEAEVTAAARKG